MSVSEKLSRFYCADKGRPAKPSRAKVGLLILKHLYRYSDAELVDLIKRDIYAQYLCDVSLKETKNFINSSTLSKFRKQIGVEGVKLIEQKVFKSLQRTKLLKGRRLVCDTTVVPCDIAYPTDVPLVNKVRQKAVQYLETAKQFGVKTFRTYKRTARRVFITYQKIRHHTKQSRRKVQRKLLQFSRRNITQLKEAVGTITAAADTAASKTAETFIKETQRFIDTASTILTQQKAVYQGLPVKERIVSL